MSMPTITRCRESVSVRVAASPGRLQPKPTTIGRNARPSSPRARIRRSMTNAARAKYPQSSSRDSMMNMMPIGGMNVATVMTPSSRPSTISPCTQPLVASGPNNDITASIPSVSHPRTVTSNQSCIGPASVVVAWNTRYMTARNTGTPSHGLSNTRSMRSETVSRPAWSRPSRWMMPAAQSKRRSAPSRTMVASSSSLPACISCKPCGSGVPSKLPATVLISVSVPSPVRGSIAITGTPSSACDNVCGLISSPWRRARSFIDSATTTGLPSSSTPARKYRDRTRLVASSTATSASGVGMPSIPAAACAATRSSGDCGSSE